MERSAETTKDDPDGEYLKRNRWFESGSLQRRVCLSPRAAFECREPRLSARLCGVAWRPGRQRRAGYFKIAPIGGNISVAPYSSTAVPLMGVSENATPVPIKSGRSPSLIVRWISALGPGSTKAQHDPLIVPGKRQAGVLEEPLWRQIARLAPIEDRLGDIRREIAEADEAGEVGPANTFALGECSKGDAFALGRQS